MNWLQALPAIASVADSVIGLVQRKKAPRDAGRVAYQENMQGVLGRVEAAKAAGLHPLSVLGGSFGGSGAPAAVGTDFGAAFESINNSVQRDKEFRASIEQQKADRAARAAEVAGQAELNRANIDRLNNESAWLQEQIRSSQAEDARRSAASTKSAISFPGDGVSGLSSPAGLPGMPHIAAGGPKPLWEKVAYPDGTTENRPAGSQAEQSEVMNTIQDLSAHYGFDPRWLTGKKTLDLYRILWEHVTGKRKPPAWFMRLRPHRVTHNP